MKFEKKVIDLGIGLLETKLLRIIELLQKTNSENLYEDWYIDGAKLRDEIMKAAVSAIDIEKLIANFREEFKKR